MSLFDENAEVLSQLASGGTDLARARRIDFSHHFYSLEAALAFADAASEQGCEATVDEFGGPEQIWEVTVSRPMMPTCSQITEAEERLAVLAESYGGHSEGWGFLSPPPQAG